MTAGPIQASVLRAGDRGWLAEVEPDRIAALVDAIGEQPWAAELQDIVPAAHTVLVVARKADTMDHLAAELRRLLAQTATRTLGEQSSTGTTIRIPVRYDGPDLPEIADRLGLPADEIVRQHTSASHRVGFFGFAPGFAYIDGLPGALKLPRRSSPRPRVTAGLVAIAGTQTVVYPGG
ncbi:MAG: carboxyltransferase domain-containing protein, partial [Rhodococcus sp. (in: high G+C Gram-positive bacteria)]